MMNSGINFVAADMPSASDLTIHILAAVAEDERKRTAERTKVALQALKDRGVKLGAPAEALKAAGIRGNEIKAARSMR
ncbi:MAG: recombinase family protein [Rhodospirillales bacterium]